MSWCSDESEHRRQAQDDYRRAGGAIAQRAPVDSVAEDGTLMARVNGKVVRAQLATEEPIIAGETAWVSKTRDGQHIAHGSAH